MDATPTVDVSLGKDISGRFGISTTMAALLDVRGARIDAAVEE